MAVVGSGRCIGMIDLMITQLSCWLDPSIWLLYILYAAVALSSLIHLAELSCQPEGHGHLAASCLSTYLHAHTRTERVMVLIEERPSLPPNRACLRCNRTHTHAPVKSRPAASASRQLFSQARPAAPCWQQWKGDQQHQQQAPALLPAGRLSHRSRHLLPSIFA